MQNNPTKQTVKQSSLTKLPIFGLFYKNFTSYLPMVLYPTFGSKFRNFAVCGSYAIFKSILSLSSTIGVQVT
jgi:hypothetical protein